MLCANKNPKTFWQLFVFALFCVTICTGTSCRLFGRRKVKNGTLISECAYCYHTTDYKLNLELSSLFNQNVRSDTKFLHFSGVAQMKGNVFTEPGAQKCSADDQGTIETMFHMGVDVEMESPELFISEQGKHQNFTIFKTFDADYQFSDRQYRNPFMFQFNRQFANNTELVINLPFTGLLARPKSDVGFKSVFGGDELSVMIGNAKNIFMGSAYPSFGVTKDIKSFQVSITRPINSNLATNLGTPTTKALPEMETMVNDVFPEVELAEPKIVVVDKFQERSLSNVLPGIKVVNVWVATSLTSESAELATTNLQQLIEYYHGIFGKTGLDTKSWNFIVYPGLPREFPKFDLPHISLLSLASFQPTKHANQFLHSAICYHPVSNQVALMWMPEHEKDREILAAYVGKWGVPVYDQNWLPDHCCVCKPKREVQVLEMLEGIFSRETMQQAMKHEGSRSLLGYMHQLENSITRFHQTSLLPENGRVSVVDVYLSWSANKFKTPHVHVTTPNPSATNATNSILLLQNSHKNLQNQSTFALWWVPVKYLTANGTDLLWVTVPFSYAHTSPIINAEEWLILNPDNSGLYTVSYNATILDKITAQLNCDHTRIPEMARYQLLNNQFSLLGNSWESQRTFLELTTYFKKETSLKCLQAGVSGILKVFSRKKTWTPEVLQAYVDFYAPMLSDILLNPEFVQKENCISKWLTKVIWDNCTEVKIPACMEYARKKVTNLTNDTKRFEESGFSTFTTQMACSAIQMGPAENETDRIFNVYMQFYLNLGCDMRRSDSLLCKNIINALACTQNITLIKDFFKNGTYYDWEPQVTKGLLRHNPDSEEILVPLYIWWKAMFFSGTTSKMTENRFIDLVNKLPRTLLQEYRSKQFPLGLVIDAKSILAEFNRRLNRPVHSYDGFITGQKKITYAKELLKWFEPTDE